MSDAVEVEHALRRASRLVDDRVGIVRQVVVHEVGPCDPLLFFSTAQLASTRPFSDASASSLNGGAGIDRASAIMGALGEAIERYSIGIYRETELVRGSFREMETSAMDPRHLIFFAENQYGWTGFPYVPFDAATPISWVAGVSLLDSRERLVPAFRVYTPYRAPRPSERILQSTSTGAASHVDCSRAVLAGLYECIERDALMIAWLNRLALPIIDPTTIDRPVIEVALDRLERRGLSVRLFDATSDLGIPTVLSIVMGPPGTVPSLAVGAATRATIGAAAEKAIIESAHTLFWIHTRCREDGLPVLREDYDDVTSLDVHSLLYGDPRMRDKVAFLSGDVPAQVRWCKAAAHACDPVGRQESVEAELERCVARLHHAEIEAVAVDVTPRDIRDSGFVVVRVVAADLHPLWGGHHVRCLGGRRVREVPVRLGYLERPLAIDELNTDPHPMP
ncbi:MAG: YcaO-like family protein [Deltaproteobacteria bacterium]|nr:YcaO-like family protein [Deltaproteobacteria bacterium]